MYSWGLTIMKIAKNEFGARVSASVLIESIGDACLKKTFSNPRDEVAKNSMCLDICQQLINIPGQFVSFEEAKDILHETVFNHDHESGENKTFANLQGIESLIECIFLTQFRQGDEL